MPPEEKKPAAKAAPAAKHPSDAKPDQKIYHPDKSPKDDDETAGGDLTEWRTMAGEDLRGESNKITVMKQMINTSDGSAEETDAYVQKLPEYDNEVPDPIDYRETEYELSDKAHAGVAEDDEAGVEQDDPAGSAEWEDNYDGSGATKSHFVLDEEERNEKVIKANKERIDGEAKAALAQAKAGDGRKDREKEPA